MNKLRTFSRKEAASPPKEKSSLPKRVETAESRGELSPALSPIATLLSAQAHRRYHEGVFMILKDLDSEGQPAERKWEEVYGVLTGNQLAVYRVEDMEEVPSVDSASKPSYINFTDATFKAIDQLPSSGGNLNNVIIVSTTLKNRYLIQISSTEQFRRWHAAFRLAAAEYRLLQEAYTGALLSARGSLLSDIKVILAETKFEHEDWTSVRFGAGMPWKRCFTVIEPPAKRSKKKFVPGRVVFYESEKKGKKLAMATITEANSIYAVYPQNYSVIDHSTMIKLDGSIVFSKSEGTKDCSIFLMPDQHSSVPGYDTLIRFLIPLLDAFHLYGRPKGLNADKLDPNSLLFALPVLPKVHYLEVDDLMQLTASATTSSWTSYQWQQGVKEILRPKVAKGYDGCGSVEGTVGAAGMLEFSRDLAAGKVRSFSNPQSPTMTPKPQLGFERKRQSSGLARETPKAEEETPFQSLADVEDKEDSDSQYSELRFRQRAEQMQTPELQPAIDSQKKQSSPGGLAKIYSKYAQLPDYDQLNETLANLDVKDDTIEDLYPNEESDDGEDDDDDDYDIQIINPRTRTPAIVKSSPSPGLDTTPVTRPHAPYGQPNPRYGSTPSLASSTDSGEHSDRRVLSQERVVSPFTAFNKSYQEAIRPNFAGQAPSEEQSPGTLGMPRQRPSRQSPDGESSHLPAAELQNPPQRPLQPYYEPQRSGSSGSVEYRPAQQNLHFPRAPPNNIVSQQVAYGGYQNTQLQSPYNPQGPAAYDYQSAPRPAPPTAGYANGYANGYAAPQAPEANMSSPRRRPPPPLNHSQQHRPQSPQMHPQGFYPQRYARPYPEPPSQPQQSFVPPQARRDKNNPYALAKSAHETAVSYHKNPYSS
ncbi:hypothetical protein KL949_004394 [Ogataea haglerorum]|nr:hypothetical protein KL913_004480 [Ogataea haglerorum]KAG7715480.1 hypothetical protein KL949_004394 [Ogataea haglerorum]KAG7737131.1 hypothetical protein KL932_004091 [Ogataea haglerorum]KAG7746181.1 hypothetical protein KL912_004441 [Ogataea haglerorum]KAG7755301.1 hypothetical protein KL947_004489 [Ogataea haglerorum]